MQSKKASCKAWQRVCAAAVSVTLLASLSLMSASAWTKDDWNVGSASGKDYGSVTANADGTYTLKGAEEQNSDNSHCGPYTTAGAKSLVDSDRISDEIDVAINPSSMTAGEKFALTVSLNGTDEQYKTELLVNFWKDNDGSVAVSAGLAPNFSAKITKAGIYTLAYGFSKADGKVYADFTISDKNGTVAETEKIDLNLEAAACGARGYVWFSDISVASGLTIGCPNVQDAPILKPSDWVSGEGYGSVDVQSDNVAVLKGSDELNADNSHSGPYVKGNGNLLENGVVTDEVHVKLDPAALAAGEKFSLTASVNGTDGTYLTEFLVNFWKDNDGAISVQAGVDPSFATQLTEGGIYTLRYEFIPVGDQVLARFSIVKDGKTVATTSDVTVGAADEVQGRGYIWFSDISVADGLEVYGVIPSDEGESSSSDTSTSSDTDSNTSSDTNAGTSSGSGTSSDSGTSSTSKPSQTGDSFPAVFVSIMAIGALITAAAVMVKSKRD